MGSLPSEVQNSLDELSKKAAESHREFNAVTSTLTAGILTVSITVISAFVDITKDVSYLIFSWICFALILVVIIAYGAFDADAKKMMYFYESNSISAEKKYTAKEVKRLMRKIRYARRKITAMKLTYDNAHWVVLGLFIIGMGFLLKFTISNIRANQSNESKSLDVQIKKLQIEELQKEILK